MTEYQKAEEFVRSVLFDSFNQKLDPRELRAVTEKVLDAVLFGHRHSGKRAGRLTKTVILRPNGRTTT